MRDLAIVLTLASVALLMLPVASDAGQEPQAAPVNFIFFLADDLGWMDVGAFGSRYYETPNLDRLAARGMLFTDAYAASPQCSPTRASILTGQHPARLGLLTAVGNLLPRDPSEPDYPEKGPGGRAWISPISIRYLPLEETTLAEVLREAGYRTGHIGKWHLGGLPEHWPEHHGFEYSLHGSPTRYTSPYRFSAGTISDGEPGEYIEDRIAQEARAFISRHQDEPFLLNLWHFGVHGPWGYKKEYLARFTQRSDPRGEQDNPIMGAMIKSLDESVGTILDHLDRLGLTNKTAIFFFSDNGGHMGHRIGPERKTPTNNAPLRGSKSTLFEGGIRVPLIVSWPGVAVGGTQSSYVVSSVDFYPTILDMAEVGAASAVVDGTSFAPVLRGQHRTDPGRMFSYFPTQGGSILPGFAIREGDYKLIRWWGSNSYFPESLELYDLANDIGEKRSLSKVHPQIAEMLLRRGEEILAQTGALLPRPNPAFVPLAVVLDGWHVPTNTQGRTARLKAEAGVLHVIPRKSKSKGALRIALSYLNHPKALEVAGPHRIQLRVRSSQDLSGMVLANDSGVLADGPARSIPQFSVGAGRGWSDISALLDLGTTPVEIIVEFQTSSTVEIDEIVLEALDPDFPSWPTFTQRRIWRFDS